MLEWRFHGITFRLSLWFLFVLLVMLTQDPTGLAATCVLASVLHEVGHFLAMIAARDCPTTFIFGAFGVRVEHNTVPLSYGKAVCISLCGPLMNVLCAVVCYALDNRDAALIHGVLAGFHLLPVAAMDGGEAMYAVLSCFFGETRARSVCMVISAVVLFPLAVLGFYLLFQTGYNVSLLLLSVYLITLLIFKEKH